MFLPPFSKTVKLCSSFNFQLEKGFAPPSTHLKKCLTLPDNAEEGYTISIAQSLMATVYWILSNFCYFSELETGYWLCLCVSIPYNRKQTEGGEVLEFRPEEVRNKVLLKNPLVLLKSPRYYDPQSLPRQITSTKSLATPLIFVYCAGKRWGSTRSPREVTSNVFTIPLRYYDPSRSPVRLPL